MSRVRSAVCRERVLCHERAVCRERAVRRERVVCRERKCRERVCERAVCRERMCRERVCERAVCCERALCCDQCTEFKPRISPFRWTRPKKACLPMARVVCQFTHVRDFP